MERVRRILTQQNIRIEDAALEKMALYMDEILERNKSVNLTAITDRDEFIQKHFVDSLLCAGYVGRASDGASFNSSAGRVLDLGTGAGFPGIPLAIAFSEKDFVLIDSLNKRIKIIVEICAKLGINNVTAIHGRAEELARKPELREQFDVCVSRAVANMSTLSEYCLPFVKKGGTFIAYKGPDCEEEVGAASKAIDALGGGNVKIVRPDMDGVDFEHTFVFVEKEKSTPKAYPRKAGMPSKKPL